jgi:hypothetical protein
VTWAASKGQGEVPCLLLADAFLNLRVILKLIGQDDQNGETDGELY